MSTKKSKLIIIDGNALIHRSFHALPPTMTTKDGHMINAVYGFTTTLIKAINDLKPEYIVLTLDEAGPTFRHKEYKEYKATRIKQADELYAQIPLVRKVASAFNIPVFSKQGFEADDVIGTIVKQIDGKIEKFILTGDMDTLQLIDDHTKVYTMSRGIADSVTYDAKGVFAKYGLNVSQIIDYKALRGDPSDNIPGVRGIGEKTATTLLQEFQTLENLYNQVESQKLKVESLIKPRVIQLLKENKSDALLSKQLATIKCNVDIDFELEKTKFGNFDKNKIIELFSELEFNSLLPRVQKLATNVSSEDKAGEDKFARNDKLFKYKLIKSNQEKDFQDFLKKLKAQNYFTFDTETTSKNSIEADLLGISFAWRDGEACYVEVKSQKSKVKSHRDNLFNYNSPNQGIHTWLVALKPIFENEKIRKAGHNIKYDINVLASYDTQVKGVYFDTRVASYILNPGTRQHDLDSLAFSELGHDKINKEDLLGKGKDKIAYSEVEVKKMANYSCEDADFTHRLIAKLKTKLKEQKIDKLFYEIEVPLVSVLAKIEQNGILINQDHLSKMNKDLSDRLKEISKKIYKEAGDIFNINSTQQLKAVLFQKLDISTLAVSKTKTGFSTAAKELAKLKDEHIIIPLIQEYRELAKLLNTYIIALPKLINPITKRIHTSFNQTITSTGRLSSLKPNLQNIPIKSKLGREIRKTFVAQTGFRFLSLDYSQIELRLAAHLSLDKKMIQAFCNNCDIHASTASAINNVELEDVTSQMRREAKAINFGVLYGQGPHGLAQTANITYGRAKEFIDQYFEVYDGVKKYIDDTIEKTRELGYVETLLGRRRYLHDINATVVQIRKAAERMAVNTPLQGTAADLIKMAMIKISSLIENNDDIKMFLQVHDELVFEVKEELVKETALKIKDIMENIIKLKVPIDVHIGIGNDWGNLKQLNI